MSFMFTSFMTDLAHMHILCICGRVLADMEIRFVVIPVMLLAFVTPPAAAQVGLDF